MRFMLVIGVGLLSAVVVPSLAWAHEGDETEEGYVLVQQALGHLVHDSTSVGIDLAMEKVTDALATKDQEGVDVSEVEGDMTALKAGQVDQARGLLQDSRWPRPRSYGRGGQHDDVTRRT